MVRSFGMSKTLTLLALLFCLVTASHAPATTPGAEKWVFPTGDQVTSSPAIGPDGTIYVGSADYNLYAINPDGTEKWAFTTGGNISWTSPAIGPGPDWTIYVGSADGHLYAINPNGTKNGSSRHPVQYTPLP